MMVEVKAPHSASAGGDEGGVAEAQQLLSKSFLSCLAMPFLVLWLERSGFLVGAVCPCPLAFSGYRFSRTDSELHKGKGNPENSPPCCSLGPKEPS